MQKSIPKVSRYEMTKFYQSETFEIEQVNGTNLAMSGAEIDYKVYIQNYETKGKQDYRSQRPTLKVEGAGYSLNGQHFLQFIIKDEDGSFKEVEIGKKQAEDMLITLSQFVEKAKFFDTVEPSREFIC